jgi:hypothetical protein
MCQVAFYQREKVAWRVEDLLSREANKRQELRQACGASAKFAWSEASSDGENAAHVVWNAIGAGGTYDSGQIVERCAREVARAQIARAR